MPCYLDRAWCHSDCVNRECDRNLTPYHAERAISFDLPVCYANFRADCPEYVAPQPPETPNDPA